MIAEIGGPVKAKDLLARAVKAAKKAHAPYSKFRVGAAVEGERGVYLGANVENASYGLGLCAERAALAAAVAAGDRKITAVAIACIDAPKSAALSSRMPCGACRQWLAELAPDAAVTILGAPRNYSVAELLPHAFKLRATPKR